MACEPFDCERCGERHERCKGHVDDWDEDGNLVAIRACRKWPMRGASVCQKHGGSAPQVRAAALRRIEEEKIRREVDKLGLSLEVDPTEALLSELWETAANIAFYRQLIQQLPTHPEPDQIIGHDDKGKPIFRHGEPGIYGRTYHQSGVPTGEAKENILVRLYNDERKHLVDIASAAVRLGLEERRVNLEENRAETVFRAVTQALSAMGLGERFAEFREHFHAALTTGRPVLAGAGGSGDAAAPQAAI